MTIEQKLNDLGYTLPTPAAPAASYVPVRQSGKLLFVSGQISQGPDGVMKGCLGDGLDVQAGQKAAELCAVSILAQVNTVVPLSQIKAIQKLTVLVASTPAFNEQHLVANGASDLFIKLLGDTGKHARAAFGVASLPLGAAVEIDAIVEIE
ncbi:RidA family protein [Pelagibacterium halotolerans]|uniref:Endoribonuclease L-PSP n=1 Tax=Pelagibacterium halotolerans (strain DSM 22347 / JCM 15775 / CGMCC 1.7692 / B2) TaxID=1082931 RepID=G4RBY3_PELHB|nr:RidA family protein [Pelagibacterium halotolerans]AEQ51631.1 endoribonuclease L-PSP [Pelagibacterium halotolerans B2]QJR18540.1 RidA family protein [Pelagibacterium halotolerans]SEA18645.1 Enamine deaminase RidA, house cleaning of reactive enamine intermediates, YjgF/YER057c/UK114 family [Pelagibacterium halotolerans]